MPATTALGGALTAQTVVASTTATQADTAGAVLATVSVPGDASIVEIILTATDIDSGIAAITLDVGDSSGPDTPDDNRFISATTIGQGGGTIRASTDGGTNGLLNPIYTYSTTGDQDIECTVAVAAGTGAAGTVTMTVIYFRNS